MRQRYFSRDRNVDIVRDRTGRYFGSEILQDERVRQRIGIIDFTAQNNHTDDSLLAAIKELVSPTHWRVIAGKQGLCRICQDP